MPIIDRHPALSSLAPLCEVCTHREGCAGAGTLRPEFPACYREFRNAPMAQVRRFSDDCFASAARSPEARAALRHVLSRFAEERAFSSQLFEPSVSWDGRSEVLARFAYGLPSFRRQPGKTVRWAHAFGAAFGPSAAEVFLRLLQRVRQPCVELLLVGAAFDGPHGWRAKLYVQFKTDAQEAALALAGVLTAVPDLARRSPRLPLHLLGIDVGPRGIQGVKFYFWVPRLGPRDRTTAPVPLLEWLWSSGVEEMKNVLSIHRVTAPEDPSFEHPAELDFHLGENGLRWSELARSEVLRPVVSRMPGYADLAARYDLAVRRVSVPIGATTKMNLYLAFAEQEPLADV